MFRITVRSHDILYLHQTQNLNPVLPLGFESNDLLSKIKKNKQVTKTTAETYSNRSWYLYEFFITPSFDGQKNIEKILFLIHRFKK